VREGGRGGEGRFYAKAEIDQDRRQEYDGERHCKPSTRTQTSILTLLFLLSFSLFRWRGGKSEDGEEVLVNIESPSSNVRRISSFIVINRPLQDVWRILTDYDK